MTHCKLFDIIYSSKTKGELRWEGSHIRRFKEIIPQTEIGDNHHFIPKSAGGTETVRLTIREHIFAHELLVMIYRQEEPDTNMLFNMLMSIERMCGGNSSQITRMDKVYHKSRIVENMILESRKLR